MRLGKLGKKLAGDWRHAMLYAALIAAAAGLLWFQLGTLPGGYSLNEAGTAGQAVTWKHILDNPVNAPFSAAVKALGYVLNDPLYITRIVAAVCGFGALVLFYGIARYWYGERTALMGAVLFGTSAWFLHTARLGVPDVLLFGVLALIACFIWLKHTSSSWALLACFVVSSLLLYAPGMFWFVAIGLIWQWRVIDRQFKKNLWAMGVGGLILIAVLTPLGLALYHHPDMAKVFAGLPAQGWPDVIASLKRLAEIPFHLFVRGDFPAERWVGNVPVIDYFTTAMFALGGYVYCKHIKLKRFWLVAATLIVGAVLASLGGAVTLTIIVPFIYIVAAAGAGFMLDRWLVVFPRNGIAQAFGTGLVCLALLTASWYSLRHYFIAWPQTTETVRTFTVPRSATSVTINKT
jgi:hypothetical protein